MADYTPQDLAQASVILESLLEGGEDRTGDLEKAVSITDLEADAQQFLVELDLVTSLDVRFPAARIGDGEHVPVSFLNFVEPLWGSWGGIAGWRAPPRRYRGRLHPFYFDDDLREWLAAFDERSTLSPDAARKSFSTRAREFLATRFAGARALRGGGGGPSTPRPNLVMAARAGGSRVAVAGCHFSIHTNSPGLTTHWSGAYYISPSYFGAPTTPAFGVLQAGTYVFGVTGGGYGNTLQWDFNSVCTLPGAPSVHLNY